MNRLGIIQSSWVIHGWGQGMPVQSTGTPVSPGVNNDVPVSINASSISSGLIAPVDGTPSGMLSFLPMSTI